MTGEELLKETVALEQYLATFDDVFGRAESRAHRLDLVHKARAVLAGACLDRASLGEALRWFSAHRLNGNYVLIFTAVMAVWSLYGGAGVARASLETVHTFCFFWACAAIGELYLRRSS